MDEKADEIELNPVPLLKPLPGEVIVRAPKGVKPLGRTGVTHGFHCNDVIEIPTSLSCSVCPLYAVKKKNPRHNLACPEGRKNRICPILTERQINWAEELIGEIRDATGEGPTASDRAKIEQIVRHRSRVFQSENYLKVAGYIDIRQGKIRNVGERMISLENALSRSFAEFRQGIADRKAEKPKVPTLDKYLEVRSQEREGSDGESKD